MAICVRSRFHAGTQGLNAAKQTDDILPFRTSLTAEYALLLADKPLGLGLSEAEVTSLAAMGMASRFPPSKLSK